MIAVLMPLWALLLAVALLVSGAGLLTTLLAIRGDQEGFSGTTLGLLGSAYFVGFFIGTYLAPRLIARVGHVRAVAICSALATCSVLLQAVLIQPQIWMLLRVVTGISLVGLYTAIESWLNAQAPPQQRGQIFATYIVINLAALALGQQLLRVAPTQGAELFIMIAVLLCIALIPVTWTRLPQPDISQVVGFPLRRMWQEAPSAALSAVLNGMAMGAYWSLVPLFAAQLGMNGPGIADFIALSILGGALLQWPLGRWSDRSDRRVVLAMISAGSALLALAMLLAAESPLLRNLVIFCYGALAFAIYPISVAHLLDRLQPSEGLSGISRFLLLYGIGAASGPALAGIAVQSQGPLALFVLFALTQGALAIFVVWRIAKRSGDVDGYSHFLPMLRTTPTALEMVPPKDVDDANPNLAEDGRTRDSLNNARGRDGT